MILKKRVLLGCLGIFLGLSSSVHAKKIVYSGLLIHNKTNQNIVVVPYRGGDDIADVPAHQKRDIELGLYDKTLWQFRGRNAVGVLYGQLKVIKKKEDAFTCDKISSDSKDIQAHWERRAGRKKFLVLTIGPGNNSGPEKRVNCPEKPVVLPAQIEKTCVGNVLFRQVSFANKTAHDLLLEEKGWSPKGGSISFGSVTIPKGQRSVRGIGWPLQQGHQATSLRFEVRQKTGSPQQAWVVRFSGIDTYGGYCSYLSNRLPLRQDSVEDSGPNGVIETFTFSPRP